MKLPHWFRVAWWWLVLAAMGYCIYVRLAAISGKTPISFDVALIVFTAAVALVTIYAQRWVSLRSTHPTERAATAPEDQRYVMDVLQEFAHRAGINDDFCDRHAV